MLFRSRFGMLLVGAGLLSSLAVLGAMVSGLGGVRIQFVFAAWLLSLAGLWRTWRRQPTGELRWDGEHWYWAAQDTPLQGVTIQFDFQSSVWLYVCTHNRQRIGLWLDQNAQESAQWSALRRALVGSTGVGGSPQTTRDRRFA